MKVNCYEENYEMVTQYYQCLVEAFIEFKIYSRILIAYYKNEQYTILPEHEIVAHSNQFELAKDPESGYTYCLSKGQSF